MKKNSVLALAVLILCGIYTYDAQSSAGGIPMGGKKPEPQVKPQAADAPSAVSPSTTKTADPGQQVVPAPRDLKRQRLLISRKKEEINNTEWDVELNPLTGKGKSEKDKIIFMDRKVMMNSLTKEGFPATNFTLTLKDDERAVWETMQSKGEDIVFFKGEISTDLSTMTGIVSFQRLEGTKDFSFKSTLKKEVVPEPEPKAKE